VYELNEGQHHDHLVCLDCGRVEEFYDAEIEKRQNAVALSKAFPLPTMLEPVCHLHQAGLPEPPGSAAARQPRIAMQRNPGPLRGVWTALLHRTLRGA